MITGNTPIRGSGLIVAYTVTSSSNSGSLPSYLTVDDSNLLYLYPFLTTDICGNKLANHSSGSAVYDASLGYTPTIGTSNSFASGRTYITINGSSTASPIKMPGFQMNQICTACIWMKCSRSSLAYGSQINFLSFIQSTGGNQGYMLAATNNSSGNNNVLNPFINGWQFNETFSTNSLNSNDGNWHHYAFILNKGSGDILYVDGQYYDVASNNGYDYVQYAPLYNIFLERFIIGNAFWSSNNYIDGAVGDFRLYTRPLIPLEINNLYNYGTIKPTNTSFTPPTVSGLTFLSNSIFTYTGSYQSITVPAAATSMVVSAWGAGGASAGNLLALFNQPFLLNSVGGGGGFTQAIFNVTALNQSNYRVLVGGAGLLLPASSPQVNSFGGGGYGTDGNFANQGGGGRSALQLNNNDIITAGGGGSSGFTRKQSNQRFNGGAGGGLVGGNPDGPYGISYAGEIIATGGTQSAGGATDNQGSGTAGSKYLGGNGLGGGCGGGGYYGGGGAGYYRNYSNNGYVVYGGGGGSSYIDSTTIATSTGFTNTISQANKSIPPNLSSIPSAYANLIGFGGGEGGSSGGNGLVIISFYQ